MFNFDSPMELQVCLCFLHYFTHFHTLHAQKQKEEDLSFTMMGRLFHNSFYSLSYLHLKMYLISLLRLSLLCLVFYLVDITYYNK